MRDVRYRGANKKDGKQNRQERVNDDGFIMIILCRKDKGITGITACDTIKQAVKLNHKERIEIQIKMFNFVK